jgi:hypothetical protein
MNYFIKKYKLLLKGLDKRINEFEKLETKAKIGIGLMGVIICISLVIVITTILKNPVIPIIIQVALTLIYFGACIVVAIIIGLLISFKLYDLLQLLMRVIFAVTEEEQLFFNCSDEVKPLAKELIKKLDNEIGSLSDKAKDIVVKDIQKAYEKACFVGREN